MSEIPPAPQVSADGCFYWDGETWVPMPGQAPTPAKRLRFMPGRVLIVIALVVLGVCGVLVVGHPSVSDAPACTYSPANGAYVSVSGPDADRFCSVGDLATAGRGENPPANSIEVCELHSQDRQITLKVFADASSDQTEARNTCADLRTSYPD